MKKGINIWTFTDRDPEACFSLAEKYGFDGVEIGLGPEGPVRYDTTPRELDHYMKVAKKHHIAFYSLVCDDCWMYPMTADDPQIRQKGRDVVEQQLRIASYLGCETVLVIPGMVQGLSDDDPVVPYDVAYERAKEAMMALAVSAEKQKVELGVENVWNKFLLSPLEMRNFIDEIGSRYVRAYFDVGNVVVSGFPEHWISILGDRIAKVHFKDFKRKVGTLSGFTGILDGDVNYPAVMRAFKEAGYDGWVTAEVPPVDGSTEKALAVSSLAMDKILNRNGACLND